MTACVYVAVPYWKWDKVKQGDTLSNNFLDYDEVRPWLHEQLAKRSGIPLQEIDPCYAYIKKPSAYSWPGKWAVLKVRAEHAVPFDDNGYVFVLNTLGNNLPSYLPLSLADESNSNEYSEEKVMESLERMFGSVPASLFGPPKPRAFLPTGVTRQMVCKVWMYRNLKRLRSL